MDGLEGEFGGIFEEFHERLERDRRRVEWFMDGVCVFDVFRRLGEGYVEGLGEFEVLEGIVFQAIFRVEVGFFEAVERMGIA